MYVRVRVCFCACVGVDGFALVCLCVRAHSCILFCVRGMRCLGAGFLPEGCVRAHARSCVHACMHVCQLVRVRVIACVHTRTECAATARLVHWS